MISSVARSFAALAVALSPLVLGCSGGHGTAPGISPDGGSVGSSGCTVTLSGAITGSYACNAEASYDSGKDHTLYAVTAGGVSMSASLAISFELNAPGRPQNGNLSTSDASVALGANAVASGKQYSALVNQSGEPTMGSGSLDVQSTTQGAQIGSGTTYSFTGTADATLPAVTATGASGTVTMHIELH